MSRQDLTIQILMLLDIEQRKMRNSEITGTLWEGEREHSCSNEAFKVKVTRELQRLNKDRSVRRHVIGPKNVVYNITKQGKELLNRFLLRDLISTMPPTEIQVISHLAQILISKVFILVPYEATLEEYIRMLKSELDREDIVELARALADDPKKKYSRFYEYIKRYRAETMLAFHGST